MRTGTLSRNFRASPIPHSPAITCVQLAVAARPRPRSATPTGDSAPGSAPALVASPGSLFVEILNHYLLFFDQGCQQITAAVLQVRSMHA